MLDVEATAATPAANDPFAGRLLSLLSAARATPQTATEVARVTPEATVTAPRNYVMPGDLRLGEGGPKAKAQRNLEAIRTLHRLEREGSHPNDSDQRTLVQYVGWGGLPQCFRREDGSIADGWASFVVALEEELTSEELEAARRSTTDAHYTPRVVIEAIYAGLQRMGFAGGAVLEPGCGIGHFLGLAPASLRDQLVWSTVELDTVTAGVARALYPQATHVRGALEDVTVPRDHYDLAIGNPPFGAATPHDKNHRDLAGFTLHNFFVAKSLRAIVPGGLLAMVVSRSLMDKASGRERAWLAERAHLLAAIRLPNNTFTATAGTSVTTDILFLQRARPGETPDAKAWRDVVDVPVQDGEKSIAINAYFARNPHMMLGRMAMISGAHGLEPALLPDDGTDLAARLASAIAELPDWVAQPARSACTVAHTPTPPPRVPVFGHFIAEDGTIWQRQADVLDSVVVHPARLEGRSDARMRALIDLSHRLRSLIDAELCDETPGAITRLRSELDSAYDRFTQRYGFLNSQTNVSAFADDASAYLVRALEMDYQRLDLEEAQRRGIAVPKGRQSVDMADKAPILRERVLHPTPCPHPETAHDALAVTLNQRGRVDVALMAELLNRTEDTVIAELGDKVYRTPDGEWQLAEQYLSGNVKAALRAARDAAASDPTMLRNVAALEAVQPADLSPADIHVALGSPWVPGSDYAAFASEVIGLTGAGVHLQSTIGRFILNCTADGHSRFATAKWKAREIFDKALNREPIVVHVLSAGDRYIVDHEASEAARQQAQLMQDAFAEWVFSDAERRERLAAVYNELFNTDVPRRYDGSHLTFPGKVGDHVIRLRTHQVNAVWRMICDGVVLLDHAVGSGKTFTAVAAFMEMRRMGLIRKPLLAVPNALVDQWAQMALQLYPTAKILAVSERDFGKDRRKLLFARIATGDWDMVIVAHSQFSRIRVPAVFEAKYLRERVDELTVAVREMTSVGAGNRTVKQTEKARQAYRDRLKRSIEGVARDGDTASLEDMGVDAVAIDESQAFKNLAFTTRKRNVAGLGNPAGSQRAEDLYLKVRYIQREKEHPAVFFLSGTPISNSLVELQLLQRYLATDELARRGLLMFDLWANCFAEEAVSFEIDSSGQGLKAKTVLKRFRNLPELMALYRQFADTVTLGQLKRLHLEETGKPWPVPKLAGGRPENVIVPCGEALEQYIQGEIIPRMQAIAGELGERPDPREDNALKVTNDARLAALDVRLRVPNAADDPDSKVNVAARRIAAIHHAWTAKRGTQLVFCDLSTPTAAVGRERAHYLSLVARAEAGEEDAQHALERLGPDLQLSLSSSFSVYDDLRAKLIGLGIAPHEVAFIHDAHTDVQRRALFARVNRGEVRVLIGSTSKMGAGMNVQRRMVALHHLDTPWRPSDVSQRDGRLLRQGNLFYEEDPDGFEVVIARYAVQKTFDSRMWQLQERKSTVIEQIRTGELGVREVDDVVSDAASAAEMKAAASGDPGIIEQVELEATVKRLSSLERLHRSHVYDAETRIRRLTENATPDSRLAADLARVDELEAHAAAHPRDPFAVVVGGRRYDEFKSGATALAGAVALILGGLSTRSAVVGTYRGAQVEVEGGRTNGSVTLIAPSGASLGEADALVDSEGHLSAAGLMARLDHLFRAGPFRRERAIALHARETAQLADLSDLARQPFRQAAELAEAETRLRELTARLVAKLRPVVAVKPVSVLDDAKSAVAGEEVALAA
ncbi:helicase-related protein [Rhodanobacter sp. FW106-PBR-R2A-1-13]|uniref:helicase-related protein n=1 Tax=Rhodanobacter sp. FW106-PBR-R2A-1-13 TaxID=3454845 RepID=UPI0034E3B309